VGNKRLGSNTEIVKNARKIKIYQALQVEKGIWSHHDPGETVPPWIPHLIGITFK
jgi:hypothetical protein